MGAETTTPRELLLANLDRIHELVRFLARRYRMAPDEVEELEAYVRLRLIDNDFQILRTFEGRSAIGTYLQVVVQRLFLDFRNTTWGKWRVSAAAQRFGPLASTLEELIYRDGYTFEEACQVLLVSRKLAVTEAELRALWEAMPLRFSRSALHRVPDPEGDRPDPAPSPEQLAAQAQTATRVAQVLAAALQRLPAGDRLLLRLRFAQGLAVPAIAETMHMSRKALYERTQELTRQLRRELRSAGIAARDVGELLADRLNGPMWDDLVAGSTADVEDEQHEGGVGRRES